jgi:alkyl sulfatase BDS1-like metallo-beta-lactamase superfamily hydrolase
MRSKLRLLALVLVFSMLAATAGFAAEPGPEAEQAAPESVTRDPASVPVHPTLLAKFWQFFPPAVLQVTDGVYVARGYNRDNPTLIEGKNGLIVVDPGESIPAAEAAKKAFNAELDDIFDRKPVKAIIYTHHHDCHINGASVFADDKTEIIAHENLVRNLFDEWFGQIFPSRLEGGIKMSGLLFQDAPVRPDLGGWFTGYVLAGMQHPGPSGFLLPTRTVKDELKTVIAGVEINLIAAPGETQDIVVVWLPRKEVLIQIGILYEAFPALTTLRGSGQRNPLDYVNSLKMMRGLNAEYLVALHGPTPVTAGKENVRQYLTNFSDAIQFVHDQTVQYLNRGLTPGEIKGVLQLPPHLTDSPYLQETYGSKDFNIYHIFRYYRGYYTGEVRDLYQQSPIREAEMSLELAGSLGALADKAASALERGDLEWALRLADDVLLLEPDHAGAFETKKAAMLALAEDTMNSQARNMLLSDYLLMTGQVPAAAFPFGDPAAIFARMGDHAVRDMPIPAAHRIMAVTLNASKSMATDMVVELRLTDVKKNDRQASDRFTLQVRKGILEVDPPSTSGGGLIISTTSLTWKQLILGKLTPQEAIANGSVVLSGGAPDDFYAFMDLFR